MEDVGDIYIPCSGCYVVVNMGLWLKPGQSTHPESSVQERPIRTDTPIYKTSLVTGDFRGG